MRQARTIACARVCPNFLHHIGEISIDKITAQVFVCLSKYRKLLDMLRLMIAVLGFVAFAAIPTPTAEARRSPPVLRPPTLPVPSPPVFEDEEPEAPELLEDPFAFAEPMTGERLGELVARIDENVEVVGNGYIFSVGERQLRVVYDEAANRMRVITPIIPATTLPEELLERMLQANFDAVLDVRYAIGSGTVWSVFVHPLSSLTDEDFLSGVAQTAVAAETFGSSFTSGVVVFGGGDSNRLNQELLERLRQAVEDGEDDRGI